MITIGRRSISFSLFAAFAGAIIVGGVLAVMLYATRYGIGYVEGLLLLFGLATVGIFLTRRNTLAVGFYAWIVSFAIGYRGVFLTDRFPVYPVDLLLWALLMIWFVQRRRDEERRRPWLPIWVWALTPFWVMALLTGIANGNYWDSMLREAATFLAFIPMFIVAGELLTDIRTWRRTIRLFLGVGAVIALLGTVEYLFPSIRIAAGDIIADVQDAVVTSGFRRAAFAFWGAPTASFVCLLAAPFALYALVVASTKRQRLLSMAAGAACLWGVFIGGYRSLWLIALGMGLAFVILRINLLVGVVALVLTPLLTQFLPGSASGWAQTFFIFQRDSTLLDSSQQIRELRIANAWATTRQHPLGVGWAGSGWVHSDLFQTLANQGVIAGVILFGALLIVMVRLWLRLRRCDRHSAEFAMALSLLLSLLALTGLMLAQGIQVLPQIAYPGWFVWVLVELWLRRPITSELSGTASNVELANAPNPTHFQASAD